MVTENGMCAYDSSLADYSVNDGHRVSYLEQTLGGVKRAVSEGIPVLGYQYWSLMDNFEWAEGYDQRFGFVYVDYKTQQRTGISQSFQFQKLVQSSEKSYG